MLVIDDNASVRTALVAYLRLRGHTVTEAARGDTGVQAFLAAPADVVVTDLEMPGLSGWEVARAVRGARPQVPIILITGDPEATEASPTLRALVDTILLKPFGPRALLEVIKGLRPAGAAEAVREQSASADAQAADPPRPLSVLLVEDNPGDARLMRELLRDCPTVRIVSVDTLADALTELADPRMDLVLLDLGLPDSQGVATVARIVARQPGIPIVVVTGQEDTVMAQATTGAGAASYLVKGTLSPAQLLRAIHEAMKRKHDALQPTR